MRLNLLADLSVSSPPIETRASTSERRESAMDRAELAGPRGIGEVRRFGHVLAGIGAGGADQDTTACCGCASGSIDPGRCNRGLASIGRPSPNSIRWE